MVYTDKQGYLRDTYGELVHRQIAYQKMYVGNEDKFDLPFRELKVHHIDTDKKNNKISNLWICTKENHKRIHEEQQKRLKKFKNKREIAKFLKEDKSVFSSGVREIKKKKKFECEDCGRAISHMGCCLPCNKRRKEYRELEYPRSRFPKMTKRRRFPYGWFWVFAIIIIISFSDSGWDFMGLLIGVLLIWFLIKGIEEGLNPRYDY